MSCSVMQDGDIVTNWTGEKKVIILVPVRQGALWPWLHLHQVYGRVTFVDQLYLNV